MPPEQLLFAVALGDNSESVSEHNLGGPEIVEREPETADQRAIAATKRESDHSDGGDRACHRGQAERIRRGGNVRGAGPSRNYRSLVRCDRYASHSAHVDDDALAQGASGPIVASAAHR